MTNTYSIPALDLVVSAGSEGEAIEKAKDVAVQRRMPVNDDIKVGASGTLSPFSIEGGVDHE